MVSAIRRLLLRQFFLVAAVSVVFLVTFGIYSAGSAGFGGGIAAANVLILVRCARREAKAPARRAQQALAALYRCAFQRFIAVALLFALGMGVFELDPLAVIAGFIAGQTALLYLEPMSQ